MIFFICNDHPSNSNIKGHILVLSLYLHSRRTTAVASVCFICISFIIHTWQHFVNRVQMEQSHTLPASGRHTGTDTLPSRSGGLSFVSRNRGAADLPTEPEWGFYKSRESASQRRHELRVIPLVFVNIMTRGRGHREVITVKHTAVCQPEISTSEVGRGKGTVNFTNAEGRSFNKQYSPTTMWTGHKSYQYQYFNIRSKNKWVLYPVG